MNPNTFGPLDSVITCFAYESATTALGLLESPAPNQLTPEMLSTLDNFIKVILFSEQVFIRSHWAELYRDGNDLGVQLLPEPAFGGAGKETHAYFEAQKIFRLLPRVESEEAVEQAIKILGGVNPYDYPTCVIEVEMKKISTTISQEMLVYDIVFIEETIKQVGLEKFKPVFPGEHIYLGMRNTDQLDQSIADIVLQKLRNAVKTEIKSLNAPREKFRALSLPELPPLFLLRLLSENSNRKNLAKDLIKLRNSTPFVAFRNSAVRCHQMLESDDMATRLEASKLLNSFQEFDFAGSADVGTLMNRGFGFIEAVIAGLAGKFVEPARQIAELSIDLYKLFGQRPLLALKEFGGRKTDPKILDRFLQKEFGDQFHLIEMRTISLFLGLPETKSGWRKIGASFSVSGSQTTLENRLNDRPGFITMENLTFTSADVERVKDDIFQLKKSKSNEY